MSRQKIRIILNKRKIAAQPKDKSKKIKDETRKGKKNAR